ncbi:UDP-glucose 4-epimerase (galE) [Methanocaldococcus jannaschii DSM 2661]|uniref:Putative UDP-glucose 4-epimerase n=1 Tax=Methanocaldococcus jannaschii (strain ATCC 43067 / DSM 2661 / JAL-1 / JCM 10045 / NBRC 100440) TaxID=243232 RepID=GALE_METJA|nr:SDR family oxidoreductase [Methanocaldococcus jannaschii]Q57664.1 RecName: Full=Putative UDP-glucose 4-epimerase; AltName: Full=Galactowaldenase; AltName: Full=UDP-galactose 4-epimerase [Methanocaldococcus jannaschii DSM 2661]AAB98196.1 UDP-glucose 4-epimerase (galE) [Methanocaldococcus jannaschii DSM 2661]
MILVTGGAGFIGSHIVDKLIENNYDVIILDNLTTGNKNNINPKAEFVNADIRDKDLDEKINFKDVEVVIHQAAQINVRNSVENPVYDGDINVLGTINILEMMRKYDIDKIVFASSGGAVYGEPNYLPVDENHPINPLSPYGLSKYVGEEYIKLYNRLYGIEYAILRYSNVYGERQDPKGEAGVISIFIDKMLKNQSPIIFGDGNQTRDFVYVGDVAKANLMALNWKNEIVNIGTGKETSVNELFDIIKHEIGFRGEAIYDKPREGEVYRIYLDIKKAESLGWKPEIDLKEGIKRVVNWMKNNNRT